MENFIFAVNSTLPVFLQILLGLFLRKIGIITPAFIKPANNYLFKCALPLSVFLSVAGMDIYSDFDLKFCLFCIIVTCIMFFSIWGLAWHFMKDKSQIGAFSQASARSSGAVLGFAFSMAIYGDLGMVPMIIIAAIPFFNIFSVCILAFSPHYNDNGELVISDDGSSAIKTAAVNVVKNPLIIAIFVGIPFALLKITLPGIVDSALRSVSNTSTPLALIVLGASFSGGEALTRWKGAALSSLIKLFILPAVFLPIAAAMGFHGAAMVAILILVGSPTTVTCYVMAENMHADSVLTSNAVLLSTLLSSVSITFWLFLLRSFALV